MNPSVDPIHNAPNVRPYGDQQAGNAGISRLSSGRRIDAGDLRAQIASRSHRLAAGAPTNVRRAEAPPWNFERRTARLVRVRRDGGPGTPPAVFDVGVGQATR